MNPKVGEDGRYEVVRTLKPGEERRLSESRRYAVLRRDRVQCVWCGSKGRLEIDHIIPWSAGGSDDMDNLRTLCHNCNQLRSNYASEFDTQPPRFPTAHECVYCTPELLGDPEVVSVYCVMCNKRAPGLPLNPVPREAPVYEFPEEEFYDERVERLEALAGQQREAALETIRRALNPPTEAMAEVERYTGRWGHVHEWFHMRRSNEDCPWCAARAERSGLDEAKRKKAT